MAATETSARANAALDDLYRRYVGDVYRYTYAVLGNHADAEDVTQTTFVNALRALERGETPEDPSRWLVVIAHNLVRQRWRQAASRPALVELETDVPDATDGDEQAVELEELVRALQRIPPAQREALVMRELEGRPYREIADVLGLTTSALETLLFRARRSLAEEIENVVTCQNAELAISNRLDGRLSRKDRKRLDEHLAECESCARLATMESRQRKAFKGLALLPLPIGLALFKGAPSAAAATALPTIGLGSAGATGTGTGAAGAAGAGTATGGAAVGGSLAGGIAIKAVAVVVAASVATGVGYKGVQAVRDTPSKPAPAHVKPSTGGHVAKPPAHPAASARSHGKGTGKALGHAKQHGVARGKSAAARNHGNGRSSATPPGLARKDSGAEHGNAGRAKVPTTKTSKPKVSKPKVSKPKVRAKPSPTRGPKAPKKPKPITPSPGAGAPKGSAPKGSAPKNGPSTSPVAPVAPTSDPTSDDDTTTPDGGTTPSGDDTTTTTDGPSTPTGDDGTDQPTATTPPATPPVTTPPVDPPTDNPGGGTPGPTPGTPTGDAPGSPSSGDDSSDENGRKLGHKKGKHDGRHPEDS
jgi:RNA polymerase sigma factor (sigma-70 family)